MPTKNQAMTPRTDEEQFACGYPPSAHVVASFARQLETELNEALDRINKRTERIHELEKTCHAWCMENAKANQERDEAKAENETLHKAAKGQTEFGIISRQLIANHELKKERDSLQSQLSQREVQLKSALNDKDNMHAVMCAEKERADHAEAREINYRRNEMEMLELYKLMPDKIENQYTDRLFYHLANYLHILRLTTEQLSAANKEIQQLKQSLADGKSDTERLDWMEKTLTGFTYNIESCAWECDVEINTGRTIRAAIDAAIKDAK